MKVVMLSSPLWIDHLLRHVIQVIPGRKYTAPWYFRDWIKAGFAVYYKAKLNN